MKNKIIISEQIKTLMFLLVIIFSIITLITTAIFPIYPDEIQVRFSLSRLLYDYPFKISGAPACISTFINEIPLSLYAPGFIGWVIYSWANSIIDLRIIGMLICFLYFFILYLYLDEKNKNSKNFKLNKIDQLGFILSIFLIGVVPIFLVTNRNEQLIILSLLLVLFFYARNDFAIDRFTKTKIFISTFFYLVAISVIIFAHPKGIFLIPFFILILLKNFRVYGIKIILILSMIISFMSYQMIEMYKNSFQCAEVPGLQNLLKSFQILIK
jgi:hypothetical protein